MHGITQSQLSLIEHGDIVPSPVKIDILAKLLGLPAADLVADTEVQSRYEAAHLPPSADEGPVQTARLTRSQRLVALAESYERVRRLCEMLWPASNAGSIGIDDEAYYQLAVRIYRRALEAALEYDPLIADRVFVLPSMIVDSNVDYPSLRLMLQRSVAYLNSLILEYPEADCATARHDIVIQLGLDRVDKFIERVAVSKQFDEHSSDAYVRHILPR